MSRKQNCEYPIGSVSTGTMRTEDLIDSFTSELRYRLKHGPTVSRETRKAHVNLLREIERAIDVESAYDTDDFSGNMDDYLTDLFDALGEYAGPYFYFGSHPGDGADYGYWLSDEFADAFDGLKVNDLSEVPTKYRGEVLVVNDHGNMSLYVKTSRAMREVWAVV